jgi:hypothetical protein
MSGPEPLEERTPSTWKLEVSWLFSIFGGHFLPLLDSSSRPKSMRNRIHSTGFFASSCMQFSVADPGFGIQCLFDPWIRDPGHSTGFFASSCMQFSVADPGFGIQCLFDPWIRDPGTGIGFFRIPDLWSRIPNPYFESLVTFFWVKSSIIRRKLAQIFSSAF